MKVEFKEIPQLTEKLNNELADLNLEVSFDDISINGIGKSPAIRFHNTKDAARYTLSLIEKDPKQSCAIIDFTLPYNSADEIQIGYCYLFEIDVDRVPDKEIKDSLLKCWTLVEKYGFDDIYKNGEALPIRFYLEQLPKKIIRMVSDFTKEYENINCPQTLSLNTVDDFIKEIRKNVLEIYKDANKQMLNRLVTLINEFLNRLKEKIK